MTVLRTYLGLYLYVLKLTLRAFSRRGLYLFAAPLIAVPYAYIVDKLFQVAGAIPGGFLIAGFIYASVQAVAFSLLLFVGRAIIEQRRLTVEDLQTGLTAYYGDLLNVFFVLWIVQLVLRPFAWMIWTAAIGLFPLLETVALTTASGMSAYEAVWRFMRRDAVAWFVGIAPMALLIPLSGFIGSQIDAVAVRLPLTAGYWLASVLPTVLLFTALFAVFIYRGILFLSLDNISPRARAERFGGVPSLR